MGNNENKNENENGTGKNAKNAKNAKNVKNAPKKTGTTNKTPEPEPENDPCSKVECADFESKEDCVDSDHSDCCDWEGTGDDAQCVSVDGFGNLLTGFEFNRSCMIVTIVFLILFMYKEEIMKSKFIKNLLK